MKFITFIEPFLSWIDSGKFFRKPFGWLYAIFAIISFLFSGYLIFSSIRLHLAYEKREIYRKEYEKVYPEFQKLQLEFNAVQNQMQQYQVAENNAKDRYNRKNSNANYALQQYYNAYWSKEYYLQEYQRKKNESDFALNEYNSLQAARNQYEPTFKSIKEKYDKVSSEFNLISRNYSDAQNYYYELAPNGAFHTPDIGIRAIIALIVFSLASLFFGWINFQIWWNRKSKVNLTSSDNDEFSAIPVISHYLQTIGESLGGYIAIMGFFTALIAVIFKVCFGTFGLQKLFIVKLEFISKEWLIGIPITILPIVAGFFTIFIFRVFAECIKALVVIANNTKRQ